MNIYISLDTCAQSVGSFEIFEKLKGINNPTFTLNKRSTRALMWLEPLLEIEQDNKQIAISNVENIDIENILKNPLNSKNLIDNIDNQPYLKNQHRVIFKNLGKNDPTSIEDYKKLGGFRALETVLKMEPKDVIEKIKIADIRGRGGAFFPAYIKWQTVLNVQSDIKYVI
ncbi:MAG TPA: hypothetical protein ENO40_01240, partial [Desulfurella acetivorans]|nr:hypothetical protein [Desulfurella acetivorans]